MNIDQQKFLHAPMYVATMRSRARGLSGLRGALPVSLTIDTPYQVVGQKPKYTLTGAYPGGTIYWTSFQDGKDTGEYNADYGHKVEPNGTAVVEGGAWRPQDVGRWQKEILVQGVAGEVFRAKVDLIVADPAAAQPTSGSDKNTGTGIETGGGVGNFLQQGFQLGGTFIPFWIPLAAGAAYLFLKKK